MRRIALISDHASPLAVLGGVDSGGQNVYVAQVAKHLAAMEYKIDVFTRRDSENLPEIVEWMPGVRIVHVPAGPPAFVPKEELLPCMKEFTDYMVEFCRQRAVDYDLLHANFWMSGLVAADVKEATDTPFVITFHALGRIRREHQGKADKFPDVRFDIEDRIVSEADQIIAECPQDKENLIELYDAASEKISIIPCGFDPAEFWPMDKTLACTKLGLSAQERIVLQLGRIVPRKGIGNVIQGFARFAEKDPTPTRLLVVGGESEDPDPEITPEIGRLQDIARQEGVADQVTFVGRRKRDVLRYYYSAADVFVTTPWYEPFGITPVEAMACGTPVVGAHVGGIKFTIKDGETGFLIPPHKPEALAERLACFYEQPELMVRFRRQGIERVNQHFTWQKVTTCIADLYEQVITCGHQQHAVIRPMDLVERSFDGLVQVLRQTRKQLQGPILETARLITGCFERGGKLLVCGNGGSASDAQHLAAELVGRFKREDRAGLPVVSLNADTSVMTAWSNDAGYEEVFARQVQALGQSQDILLVISTSGRSENIVRAVKAARRQGLQSIGLLGGDGGVARQLCDRVIVVPSMNVQRIQEVHALVLHLLCELVEEWSMASSEQPLTMAEDAALTLNGHTNGSNGKSS